MTCHPEDDFGFAVPSLLGRLVTFRSFYDSSLQEGTVLEVEGTLARVHLHEGLVPTEWVQIPRLTLIERRALGRDRRAV